MDETDIDIIKLGREILASERQAIAQVEELLGESFERAARAIDACSGVVILSGIGKSFLIGEKISASMASTGTRSIAIHPVDALHGDLGRIQADDLVITLSKSGASSEAVEFVRALSDLAVQTIAITCRPESSLASHSDIVLNLGAIEEADPIGLAPSASTTAMLAVGDALTLTVAKLRGFTREGFAKNHPGGTLGKHLAPIDRYMRPLDRCAIVPLTASVLDATMCITQRKSGVALVVDEGGKLAGIFTDGDLRRVLAHDPNGVSDEISRHMTQSPRSISGGTTVELALDLMRQHHINDLPVLGNDETVLGYVEFQDIA